MEFLALLGGLTIIIGGVTLAVMVICDSKYPGYWRR